MRKLVLTNFQSPGDIVMLTAAVRDLHRAHPGEFLTDVRTSCPDLWLNNPHLTPLTEGDPDVESIECHYPLINLSNHTPVHFLQGFIRFLNEHLGTKSRVTDFKGDIYIGDIEKRWFEAVDALAGPAQPLDVRHASSKLRRSSAMVSVRTLWSVHARPERIESRGVGNRDLLLART